MTGNEKRHLAYSLYELVAYSPTGETPEEAFDYWAKQEPRTVWTPAPLDGWQYHKHVQYTDDDRSEVIGKVHEIKQDLDAGRTPRV